MTPALDDSPTSPPLIPDPKIVRDRLYRLRAEARLLARLLRVAEDRVRILPKPVAQPGGAST